jgi:hypothetical protein
MLLGEKNKFSPNFLNIADYFFSFIEVCTEGALDTLDKDILVLANA